MTQALTPWQSSITRHSKSFALASRLLPRRTAENAAVIYAWCRRADDAIDVVGAEPPDVALARLRHELADIYSGGVQRDPVLVAFREVLLESGIPRQYPADLLAGMEMDVLGQRYHGFDELLTYCYRVASTVGLMMCHVMGVSSELGLRHAAHLGLAMQLTNICRDVMEDWQRGRLYLPEELLRRHGVTGLGLALGQPFPTTAVDGCRGALQDLLSLGERYYVSSDAGLDYLSARCALAVNAARRIYSGIGRVIARQGYDVRAPRAVVPSYEKLWSCAAAAASTLTHRLGSLSRPFEAVRLHAVQHGPELISL